jgi:DNA-binding NtrC family response regulator
LEPTADRLAYAPRFVVGSSDRFREFTHRLWKVRDFRAVLLLHGEVGSPFELLARELAEISIFRDGPVMVCEAAKFEPRGLIEVLAPSLLSHDAGTLVVMGVETFTAEQQKTLDNLMTGRDVFLPFARRFRLVLAATNALSDRVDAETFDETLYYKVSALSLGVPSLREMRSDIVPNAERILELCREAGNVDTPATVAPDAAEWIASQDWPGNYDELTRTILNAVRCAKGNALTLAAVDTGWTEQPGDNPATASTKRPAARPAPDPVPTFNVRPPFPIASDLAVDTTTRVAAPKVEAKPAAPALVPAVVDVRTAKVATAPAGKLFAKPAAPAPLTAKSLFRPASPGYDFNKRLTETLAVADAGTGTAH